MLAIEMAKFGAEWNETLKDCEVEDMRNELWEQAMLNFLETLTRLRTASAVIYNPIGKEIDRLMTGGVTTIISAKCMADHTSLDAAFRIDGVGNEWELLSFCSTGCSVHSRFVNEVLYPFIKFVTHRAFQKQLVEKPSISSQVCDEFVLRSISVPVEHQPTGSMACGPATAFFAELVYAYLRKAAAEDDAEWAAFHAARELGGISKILASDYLERREFYKTHLRNVSAQYIQVPCPLPHEADEAPTVT